MNNVIACVAPNCTRRDEHLNGCTDNHCTGCWPRPADHGYLCQRHYDRVDNALQVADRLTHALRNVERAIRTDPDASTIAGPRLPLTAWQLDHDAINRARTTYPGDLDQWVNNPHHALDALTFARLVHHAEQRHPLTENPIRMRRVRCGDCHRITVINRPPDWYTGHRTLECTDPACGWKTSNEDHAEAGAYVEAQIRDPYRPRTNRDSIDRAQIAALVDALR